MLKELVAVNAICRERQRFAEDEELLTRLGDLLELHLARLAGFAAEGDGSMRLQKEAPAPAVVAAHEEAAAACLKLARNLAVGNPEIQAGRWWRRGLVERLAVQARCDLATPSGERSAAWCEAVPSFMANVLANNPELRAEALEALWPHGLSAVLAMCWRRPDHGFLLLQNLFSGGHRQRLGQDGCVFHMILSLLRGGVEPFTCQRCTPFVGAMGASAWPFGRWRRLAALLPSGWLKLCGLGLLLSLCWRWRRLLKWHRDSRASKRPPSALVAVSRDVEPSDPEMVEPPGDIDPGTVARPTPPPVEPLEPPVAVAPPPSAPSEAAVAAAVKAAPRPRAKESGLARGFFNKPAKKAKKTSEPPTTGEAVKPSTAEEAPEALEARQAAAKDAVLREQEAGVRFFHSCAFREAKTTFNSMRRLASDAKLGKEEGQAYRLLANCLDKLNAPEEEIDAAYKQAMKLAHQHDDMQLSFNVLTGMGSHEVKKEHLDEAEHLYFQSLMLAKRVLSPHEEAIAEGNLGMCLGQMEGRRAESLEHFRKALKLQDGSNTHSIVTLLANYASALCADDRYEEAQKEYEKLGPCNRGKEAFTNATSKGNMWNGGTDLGAKDWGPASGGEHLDELGQSLRTRPVAAGESVPLSEGTERTWTGG
eukprot:s351_g4.t1